MDIQERLDRGADALMTLILAAQNGAQEMCEAGDNDTSAKLHMMAAYMRQAYAVGRTIDAGGIRPRSGGK